MRMFVVILSIKITD